MLLEERPGLVPSRRGRPVWRYVGRSIVVGLVLFAVALPLGLAISLVLATATDGGRSPPPFLLLLVLNLVIGTIVTFVSLRVGVVLPRTALRRPLRLGEVWRET